MRAAYGMQSPRLASDAAPNDGVTSAQDPTDVRALADGAQQDRYEASHADASQADAKDAKTGVNRDADGQADEKASGDQSTDGHDPLGLTADQVRLISDLQRRDRDVRAHEAAHQSAGAGYVGGASFSYQSGPDGRRYAVGGEVPVDTSPVSGDHAATITKMQIVRAAALAPADPSGQDLAVASAASQILASVQQELAKQRSDENAKVSTSSKEADDKKTEEPSAVMGDSRPVQDDAKAKGRAGRVDELVQQVYGRRPRSGALVDIRA